MKNQEKIINAKVQIEGMCCEVRMTLSQYEEAIRDKMFDCICSDKYLGQKINKK